MSDDLHTRLHAAITTRLKVAKDADLTGQDSWYSFADLDKGHNEGGAGLNGIDAAFIAANDPAFVIRACERDLRVLGRHHATGSVLYDPELIPPEMVERIAVMLAPVCAGHSSPGVLIGAPVWPCSEITDLATVYLERP